MKMANFKNLLFILLCMTFSVEGISINEIQLKLNTDSQVLKENIIPKTNDNASSSERKIFFDENSCDMITEGAICLFNGDRIILPYAKPKGLVGYWSFDEIHPLDNSGNRHHAIGQVLAGPGFGGIGTSGYFIDGNYLEVPYTSDFNSGNFAVTFWFFLVKDTFTASKGIRECPLLQRGKDDLLTKQFERSPALYYNRYDRNLKFTLKTTNSDLVEGESFNSNSKITPQKWFHIGIIKEDKEVKLYVNGILDTQLGIKGDIDINRSSLFIGNVPWLKEECNYPFYIDELRYYNTAVSADNIQAEAYPILGGIEPNFLQLGCMNCSLEAAEKSCQNGYQLCSSIELHTGGYQIARSLGWLNWNTYIWTSSALKTPENFKNINGLALCCGILN